jgi:site-specific DNA recombinase
MRKIRKIEPTVPALPARKKVAAYARVSMETERLHHSLAAQVSYYSELIQKNPEWEYAGVYADEAVSGTDTAKRAEFQRMLGDCENGKIDIILTKSISRFARNTVDLLETVRHLKELAIEVRFEKEHINSLSGDGEVMLTLLASFAQEESVSISNNVKWGIRKRMQAGMPNASGHFIIYGYRWEGDQLVVVPEEAAIVKRIFQNFLDGKSRLETEREFAAEGITTRLGCRWVDSNIKKILTNITYTGNMLFQKEYISDPIEKHRRQNRGELPQYYVEDTHEAIIDKETFDYVQAEMQRRRELGPLANKSLNICCFTGKIKCPYCGYSYVHCTAKRRSGRTEDYWKCGVTKKKGGRCPTAGTILDTKLKEACARALEIPEFDGEVFLEMVDHIEVPEKYTITIFMKDGRKIQEKCVPTGHQDCWTKEYRAETSKKRRKTGTNPKGASCFTSKIKCAECGNNYRRQTRKNSVGEKYKLFACATTNTCSNNCIHEDTLIRLCNEILGLENFDEDVFKERIQYIEISPGGIARFVFTDGHTVEKTYSTKKRMPGWSEESREIRLKAIRDSYTPERRQKMSVKMKQIRSEKFWNSNGK